MSIFQRFFGSSNDRKVKNMQARVQRINALEPKIQALSDAELRGKTDEFKARLAKGETLDQLLEEAFAVVREASKRTLGQRHYDVQLVGGMVLHQGGIAEMKTGEGKTLVATLAVYLNALEGKGVHVVTVNDYLARRDASWMGVIYDFLGMSVGVIVPLMDDAERRNPGFALAGSFRDGVAVGDVIAAAAQAADRIAAQFGAGEGAAAR